VKVCLDTNVWVAALATRGLCADVLRVVLAEHEVVIGQVIVDELHRALKQKLRVPADRLAAVDALLSQFDVAARPAKPSPVRVRDASDRWILATATAGGAEVLVTGDQDLLTLHPGGPLPILDPRSFWHLLRRRR
jgi:putative PIN family toxin of toxin-antitoxin system